MRLRSSALLGPVTLLAGLLWTTPANADVTAWTQVSGGAMGWKGGSGDDLKASALMHIDAGLGSSPRADYIVGGYFKAMPVFEHGLDIGLMARFANRSFQTDVIGFALDAGGYARFWGVGSAGFMGQAVLGLPLGFQLAGFGMVGSNDTYGFGGTLGIDFVRLMIDRQHLLDWWPNPRPSDNMYKNAAGVAPLRF